MTRTEIIKETAMRTGFSQKDIKTAVDAMWDITLAFLATGETVKPLNGLTLERVYKAERTARNPQTGETVIVPAKYSVKCKVGKALKDAVNA